MDYSCGSCLSSVKALIPCEYQLKYSMKQVTICKEAFDFLNKFAFIKIDKKNPMLPFNPDLKALMILRRKVHKLFDLIKCSKWKAILEANQLGEFKNLVLKDAVFTFEQLENQKKCREGLERIFKLILTHI